MPMSSFTTILQIDIREISSGLLVLRLLFTEMSRERDNLGIDALG